MAQSIDSSALNIRVSPEIMDSLLATACEQDLTLNTLAERIFKKYLQFDLITEKYGLVSLRKEWYRNMLESVDERQFIERTRQDVEQLRDFLMVKYKKENLRSFCDSLKAMGNYSKLWRGAFEIDGYKYKLAFLHDFGQKHSLLLGTSIHSILTAIGVEAATPKLTNNTVVIEFDASTLPSQWR